MHYRTIILTWGDLSMPAAEWADKYKHIRGLSDHLILERVKVGWSVEKSVTTPSRQRMIYMTKTAKRKDTIKIDDGAIDWDPLLQFKRLINQVGEIEAVKRMNGVTICAA